jgi:tRNA threonylcarbamoyladenosine biosynthesis protein TsaB
MALILNLETATTACSVALAKEGEVIAIRELDGEYTHAENLTVFVEEVMTTAGYKLNELDAIAVSKGPGSYTGLRIGVSAAKGFCYSLRKPLISVSTLQAMCLHPSVQKAVDGVSLPVILCPMIDARRMEVYCGLFTRDLQACAEISAEIITESSFSEQLKDHTMIFFGDGAAKCREVIISQSALFVDKVMPSAAALASLSYASFLAGEFEDTAYFEPFYLKDFIAGKKKSPDQ